MGYFDGWDWGGMLESFGKGAAAAVPAAVAGIIGQSGVRRANNQAAQISADNRNANVAAVTAANANAMRTLQPIASGGQPASDYLRSVMAINPNELTPSQKIEMDDRMLKANRSMPSAFRGSGRATSAMLTDVLNRGRAGMIDANTRRVDSAANSLHGAGNQAQIGIANIQAGTGRQVAGFNDAAANDQANLITGTADSGNAVMANVASYFANADKDSEKESRYGKVKQTLSRM